MKFHILCIVSALSGMLMPTTVAAADPRPNIIIILSDDHGYTDLGIHGIDPNVQTPHMDTLARNGALIKNGYSTAPQCVPSRAGLMSGRVQNSFGLRGNGDSEEPLPLNVPTIAERLKSVGGYRTGFVGKWHLGADNFAPGMRGFDDFIEGPNQSNLGNFNLKGQATAVYRQNIRENRVVFQGKVAAAFIEKNHQQPFFLYFAPYGPHTPLIDQDDPYYLNFPVVNYPSFKGNPELNDIRRRGLAMVKAVDDAVNRVMEKLREHNLEENTIIFFAGDNGAQPKLFYDVNGTETVAKWDGSENVPLRGEKGSLWEGGIKVPMFAYWKGHIPAGQILNEPVSTLDFTATALRLAGGVIPSEFDGVDVLPYLTNQTSRVVRTKDLFWDWGEGIALRRGNWKIHRFGSSVALFNLNRDPNEFYDLSEKNTEKFNEMDAALTERHAALPIAGQSQLRGTGINFYTKGAPAGTPSDPRYLFPYVNGQKIPYPRKIETVPGSGAKQQASEPIAPTSGG